MSARHRSARWKRTRRRAKDRDGWRCVRCGKMGELEVHHKDRDPARFHDLEALETLCPRCHIKEHRRAPKDPRRAAWALLVEELAT